MSKHQSAVAAVHRDDNLFDAEHLEFAFSDQLRATFDPEQGAMWLRWNPKPRPCFNRHLLSALNEYSRLLETKGGAIEHSGRTYTVGSSILTSGVRGVFHLGGDLDLITTLIDQRNRTGLTEYGLACAELVYRNYTCYGLPITTISLVQGQCLGGGFEAALSSLVVIAERSARFGFPEPMYNLFPAMGAVSCVRRRTEDEAFADELISKAKIYSAEEMLKWGLIDAVVDDGKGPAAVQEYLRNEKEVTRFIYRARRARWPLRREELRDIVTRWVDKALSLNPRDLKLMGRIVARQDSLV
jgi:DSF synthase